MAAIMIKCENHIFNFRVEFPITNERASPNVSVKVLEHGGRIELHGHKVNTNV